MRAHSNWIDAQYIEEFLYMNAAHLHETTKNMYYASLRNFINYCTQKWSCEPKMIDFGKCTTITFQDKQFQTQIQNSFVEQYLSTLTSKNKQTSQASILRRYFSYLCDKQILEHNPLPKEQFRRTHDTRKQGITIDEITRFITVLHTRPMPLRAAILTQLAGGLRIGELCALRTDDIEQMDNGKWKISICREALKGKVAWQIPLPDIGEVLDEYSSWKKEHNYDTEHLFIDNLGRPLSKRIVNKEIKAITQLANSTHIASSHDMRRSYAVLCNEYIKDPEMSRRLTRHKQELTWWQYVRDPITEAVEKAILELPTAQIAQRCAKEFLNLKSDKNNIP